MSSPIRDALRFERVDIVFGKKPEAAFPLIDAGLDPAAITVETGLTVGAMQASFSVRDASTRRSASLVMPEKPRSPSLAIMLTKWSVPVK